MTKKISRKMFQTLLIIFLFFVILILIPFIIIRWQTSSSIFQVSDSPSQRVAIVFGAGLQADGTPSQILRDRVRTASELYLNHKVEKLLMSGDNRFANYNEPAAMRSYAIQLGVPSDDIVLDYAGRRTYDTCYRAHAIFGLNEAILVTQTYHLPRALFTCNQTGLKAIGVSADRRVYSRSSTSIWLLRELPATFVALFDVWLFKPLPVLGKPEPIFPTTPIISKSPSHHQ